MYRRSSLKKDYYKGIAADLMYATTVKSPSPQKCNI